MQPGTPKNPKKELGRFWLCYPYMLEHVHRNTWKILTRKAASFGLVTVSILVTPCPSYNKACCFGSIANGLVAGKYKDYAKSMDIYH